MALNGKALSEAQYTKQNIWQAKHDTRTQTDIEDDCATQSSIPSFSVGYCRQFDIFDAQRYNETSAILYHTNGNREY